MLGARATIKSVHVEPVDAQIQWPSVVSTLGGLRDPVLLESSLNTTPFSRYSILAADPVISVELPSDVVQPFAWMRDRLGSSVGGVTNRTELPFIGGWIGFAAYETGLVAEPRLFRSRREPNLPLARFGLYDAAAIFDHEEGRCYAVAVEWDGKVKRASAQERLRSVESWLGAAPVGRDDSKLSPAPSFAQPTMSRRQFLGRVEDIKRYIRAGDVYQVNLTLGFDVQTEASPQELYARLRGLSPSGHAAFLRWGNTATISSSPELFLHLRDGAVTTRPIKGTRPRTGQPALDGSRRRELEKSAKDRAELAMIVDLLRNDLGRVCDYGSVRVDHEGAIEAHPTVFHRVATISGRLRGECEWCDLLAATFPCGSVTGAPKIRAMQIIEELEPAPRGPYCGAIGYIGLDGSMQFNVAIRTMVQRGSGVRLYAGSGIVADSIAEQEYEETLAKARAMLRAVDARLAENAEANLAAEAAIA